MLTKLRRFHSRLTEQEHAELSELAALLGVSLTQAAVEAVRDYLQRTKSRKPRKVAAW